MSTRPPLRHWRPAIGPDGGPSPLFARIGSALVADVRRGRLRAGDRLPGSRALAAELGVHRNTVIAAYAELLAEGWVETRPGGGTFVCATLPDPAPRGPRRPPPPGREAMGFRLAPERRLRRPDPNEPPAGLVRLGDSSPDPRLMPADALGRAYRRVLGRGGRRLLAYGDPRGHEGLRAALAAMLSARRGIALGAGDLCVVRGSQMGLLLVALAVFSPGDFVAVEAHGYAAAWDAFRLAGATPLPVPVDAEGLDVGALEALAAERPLRAVYVTPHHQYPTTVALSPRRRLALLDLARRRRLAIVEDDYDSEFHYAARPLAPLASADEAGVVVYVGSLSKMLAPGLRVGFVAGPAPLLARVAALRSIVDRQGDLGVEAALAELLDEGEIARHVRRLRRVYEARRDALAASLARRLGGALSFAVPDGGLALWARAAPGLDAEAWAERARARQGVWVPVERVYAFSGRPGPHLRLAFARLDEAELDDGVARLARALPC